MKRFNILVIVLLLIGIGVKDYIQKREVRTLADSVRVALIQADSAKSAADSAIKAARDSVTLARAVADSALLKADRAKARVKIVMVEAPDTCKPYLAKLKADFDSLSDAFDVQSGNVDRLVNVVVATADTLQKARDAIAKLNNVTKPLLDAVAPSRSSFSIFLSSLKPEVIGGVGAVYNGKVHVGAGALVGWKIKI